MANCYKCAHAKEIARLRKVCLECNIGQPGCGLSNGGVSHVSLDAAENPETVLTNGKVHPDWRAPGKREPQTVNTELGAEERANLYRLLVKFAELGRNWDDAGLVCGMLAGKTLDQMARERGLSPQTVNSRWKRIIKAEPVFLALKNGMIGKGRGRKPKRKRETQMTLGI